MEIDLRSPLTVALNLLMAGVAAGCLLVVWNARRNVGLVVFALLFSGSVAGVYVPFFAVMAAITVTVSDRNAGKPPRQHGRAMTRILRHFRGRPDPAPRPF
ncbi:MAG: hypothetical protein ACTHN0_05650 [Aquihabitans sp.]